MLQVPRILPGQWGGREEGEGKKGSGLLPAWHLPYAASRGRSARVAPERAVDETELAKPRCTVAALPCGHFTFHSITLPLPTQAAVKLPGLVSSPCLW